MVGSLVADHTIIAQNFGIAKNLKGYFCGDDLLPLTTVATDFGSVLRSLEFARQVPAD
jgi:hypothetical protein